MKSEAYEEKKRDLLEDIDLSDWLKQQIMVAEGRDMVDMLRDVEVLEELLLIKWNESVERINALRNKKKSNVHEVKNAAMENLSNLWEKA